jgi:GDP-4-dehydro-6-deoxy-D-mannose reductase
VPLITGATGFAGGHLLDQLLQRQPHVAAWANPSGQAPPPGPAKGVVWNRVDLLDREAVADALASLRPSIVYHCAGVADVGASWNAPVRALKVNVLGTHHLLDALRRAALRCPVLVTGSALVYRPSESALSEQSEIGPSNPYALSKLAQEMVAARVTWCPVFITRSFNHAGPRQSDRYVTSSFAQQIAEIEADRRNPVLRVGNLESRRDITDVRDTVRAYRLIVERGTPARPYNVCTGRAIRVRDLLDILLGLSRTRIRVEVDPARLRPSDVPVVLGDPSLVEHDTGWRAEIPIERTLSDLLDSWRTRIAPPGVAPPGVAPPGVAPPGV